MITALVMAAALTFTPAVSDDDWFDYPNPTVKGQQLHDSPISLYQGRWYVEEDNALRYCIRQRESMHAYGANTGAGKYRGAYQMSKEFKNGMAWMIQKEMRDEGVPKKQAIHVGRALRATPANKWAPYYQDKAFWLGWAKGQGREHWDATNWSAKC